ncbi:hypothetical protein BU14_0333s0004 [Porphyra umbilicalis]|uniref:Uncharacterized protein n=1 Tax=Porphyra umbilicalis TaxID=2786 RepID=A0A1X6NYJ7_PORUM|nr:hypothetical protein BU14_0333s0004 [Porphyra umbilicalis]|eukprot:OSX73615.1 hypothetical protein BU14_0333s0004 [Porphyra umbilicalis]
MTWRFVHTAVVTGGTGWGRWWNEGGTPSPPTLAARRVTLRAAERPTAKALPMAAGAHNACAPLATAAGAAATGDVRRRGASQCRVTPAVAAGSPRGRHRSPARSRRGATGGFARRARVGNAALMDGPPLGSVRRQPRERERWPAW